MKWRSILSAAAVAAVPSCVFGIQDADYIGGARADGAPNDDAGEARAGGDSDTLPVGDSATVPAPIPCFGELRVAYACEGFEDLSYTRAWSASRSPDPERAIVQREIPSPSYASARAGAWTLGTGLRLPIGSGDAARLVHRFPATRSIALQFNVFLDGSQFDRPTVIPIAGIVNDGDPMWARVYLVTAAPGVGRLQLRVDAASSGSAPSLDLGPARQNEWRCIEIWLDAGLVSVRRQGPEVDGGTTASIATTLTATTAELGFAWEGEPRTDGPPLQMFYDDVIVSSAPIGCRYQP